MTKRKKGGLFSPPHPMNFIAPVLGLLAGLLDQTPALQQQEQEKRIAVLDKRLRDYDLNARTKSLNHRKQEAQIDKYRLEVEKLEAQVEKLNRELGKNAAPFDPRDYDGLP